MPDIRLSDEGIFLELTEAVRRLKMLAEILQLRIDAMPPKDDLRIARLAGIRDAIVTFLQAIRVPLNDWAQQEVKRWKTEPPISDAC